MHYVISSDDNILSLSSDWDQVAAESRCADVFEATVVGSSIWQHVSGIETKSYLNALFFYSRQTRRSVNLNYRCDTQKTPRLFRMEIVPLEKGGLRIGHHQMPMPNPVASAPVVLDTQRPSLQCSQCLSVKVGEGWVDQMFVVPKCDFPSKYIVCPACRKQALHEIDHLQKVVTPLQMRS